MIKPAIAPHLKHMVKEKIVSIKLQYYNDPNIDILYNDSYEPKNDKILILAITNNIVDPYRGLCSFFDDMTKIFGKVSVFLGANNFEHKTHNVPKDIQPSLLNHIKSIKDNVDFEIFKDEKLNIKNRIPALANYRENVFDLATQRFGKEYDYVIVFDTDTYGINVNNIVKSLSIKNEWSCISGHLRYYKQPFYYDELALRRIGNDYNIKKLHPTFDLYYGVNGNWISEYKVFNAWHKVKAAFGGLSIYKMEELLKIKEKGKLYNIKRFPKYTAEHIALCAQLPNDILISPLINFETRAVMENDMTSSAFVPRDAGFFSVFNFLVGTIATGHKTYPYWNKEELLKIHKTNQHFAYWTTKDNCWFDYFEPVKYYDSDEVHELGYHLTYPRYSGEKCDEKFRIPSETAKLMRTNPEEFQEWRNNTHAFYKKIIKFRKEILEIVENFWNDNFKEEDEIIGIHYRHPSHFVESGKIYLEQYFKEVDNIISNSPNAKIFLASDSQFGIYSFIERYGDRVKYFKDVDRLTMAEFLEWAFSMAEGRADHVGFINGKGHELHHKRVSKEDNKKLTIDLLKEVLCLSKCNHLVNTVSNIPLAISYINPNIKIITL
jgi:hypothetical protein